VQGIKLEASKAECQFKVYEENEGYEEGKNGFRPTERNPKIKNILNRLETGYRQKNQRP
jgi:hypothetical protein